MFFHVLKLNDLLLKSWNFLYASLDLRVAILAMNQIKQMKRFIYERKAFFFHCVLRGLTVY